MVELADRMRAGIAVTSSARGSIDVYDGAAGELTPMMSYQQQTSTSTRTCLFKIALLVPSWAYEPA